jgi:hypothetical protein
MGTLTCEYHAGESLLTCTGNTPKQDIWEFHVSSDSILGHTEIWS